jgi:hypothetical protein
MEALPAVVLPDRISLFVAYMAIRRYQYTYRIGICIYVNVEKTNDSGV